MLSLKIFICSILILIWITAFIYTIYLQEAGQLVQDYKTFLTGNEEIDRLTQNSAKYDSLQKELFSYSNAFMSLPPE